MRCDTMKYICTVQCTPNLSSIHVHRSAITLFYLLFSFSVSLLLALFSGAFTFHILNVFHVMRCNMQKHSHPQYTHAFNFLPLWWALFSLLVASCLQFFDFFFRSHFFNFFLTVRASTRTTWTESVDLVNEIYTKEELPDEILHLSKLFSTVGICLQKGIHPL